MAVKWFVHRGLQFRTIDIAPALLGLGGADNIAVTVLEDVVLALTDTGAFTPILTGDSQTVKMNTLTSYWTTRQPGVKEIRRDLMNRRAPLLNPNPSDADDTRGSPATFNVHKEANTWILPRGFEQVVETPNAAAYPVGGIRERMIEDMVFDHTNLQKFDTVAEAWDAFNNYFITLGLMDEITDASAIYFVDPPSETNGETS